MAGQELISNSLAHLIPALVLSRCATTYVLLISSEGDVCRARRAVDAHYSISSLGGAFLCLRRRLWWLFGDHI